MHIKNVVRLLDVDVEPWFCLLLYECFFQGVYVTDLLQGIKETYRVVKIGGKTCLIGFVCPTYWLSCFFANIWMLFPYFDWFEKAGFKDLQIKRIG